jgi:hypothetical protein
LVENGSRAYEAGFTKSAFVRASMTLYERIRRYAESQRQAPAA